MAQERKNSDQGLIWSLRGDGGGGGGHLPREENFAPPSNS